MNQLLSVKNDFVFKKLFGEPGSEDVLINLLEAVLKIEIRSVELIKDLKLEKKHIKDKQCVIDVRALLHNGSKINIEMQVQDKYNFVKRSFFYLSKIYTEGFEEGDDYFNLKKTITVNIVDYNIFNLDTCHYRIMLRDDKHVLNVLDEIMEMHFLDLTQIKNLHDEKLSNWLKFIRTEDVEVINLLSKNDKAIALARKKLEELSADEEFRLLAESRAKYLSDYNSDIAGAKREGKEEGLEEGREEEKLEIINRMLELQMSLEDIAKIVDIALDELSQIIKDKKL